jgi:type I restriction enzyme M protein
MQTINKRTCQQYRKIVQRIVSQLQHHATPLPQLTQELETLSARVDAHLKKMGAVWN